MSPATETCVCGAAFTDPSMTLMHIQRWRDSHAACRARATGAWRVGRKVGRTIYAQVGPEPSDDDVLIGVMDTPELALMVVNAVAGDQA